MRVFYCVLYIVVSINKYTHGTGERMKIVRIDERGLNKIPRMTYKEFFEKYDITLVLKKEDHLHMSGNIDVKYVATIQGLKRYPGTSWEYRGTSLLSFELALRDLMEEVRGVSHALHVVRDNAVMEHLPQYFILDRGDDEISWE